MDSRLRKRKVREDKKPACNACRAHKLRCDASLDYSRPCTRCSRKQTVCVVQEQRRMKNGSNNSPKTLSHSSLNDIDVTMGSQPVSVVVEEIESLAPALTNKFAETQPRTIGGVCVEANKIDACFARFFRYFAPLVPILSHQPTPNQTFRESQLKFWVITAIGSRKCLEDPTLFSILSPHVESLAMQSLCVGYMQPSAYPTLEAYLLMCNFHLSTDRPFWRNMYSTLSSASTTIALQAGMRYSMSVKGVFNSMANPQLERGVRLWTYAVILNQTIMSLQGNPITDGLKTRHLVWEHDLCTKLPGWLVIEGHITAHIAAFHHLVADLELYKDLSSYSRTLKARIRVSEAELCELQRSAHPEDCGPLSALSMTIARLQIWSSAFLIPHTELDDTDIVQLAEAAIATMDLVVDLDKKLAISVACPDFVIQGIQLAACILLKLLKAYPENISFHEKDMTSALFSAINISKAVSVVNNDIPAKLSEILSQLWSSPNSNPDAEGVHIRPLKVRNRLAMNVVLDCFYWWRKLDANQATPQPQIQRFNGPSAASSNQAVDGHVELNQFLAEDWASWDFDWDFFDSLHLPNI